MGLRMTLKHSDNQPDRLLIYETEITSPEAAITFARGFNAALAAVWPEQFGDAAPAGDEQDDAAQDEAPEGEEAQDAPGRDEDRPDDGPQDGAAPEAAPRPAGAGASGKRGPITVKPGSAAAKVLACLRRGVTDRIAIADELDMNDLVVARLIAQLRAAGHWRPA